MDCDIHVCPTCVDNRDSTSALTANCGNFGLALSMSFATVTFNLLTSARRRLTSFPTAASKFAKGQHPFLQLTAAALAVLRHPVGTEFPELLPSPHLGLL